MDRNRENESLCDYSKSAKIKIGKKFKTRFTSHKINGKNNMKITNRKQKVSGI
jgi:hypothetical protein